MVSNQDRPIPPPRTSLIDRKPPVPKRINAPVVPRLRRTLPDRNERAKNVLLLQSIRLFQNSSTFLKCGSLRSVKSLPDVLCCAKNLKSKTIHRSLSSDFCCLRREDVIPDNYNGKEQELEKSRDGDLTVDSRNPVGNFDLEIVEQGRITGVEKIWDSSPHQNYTHSRKSLVNSRTSSISVNSVAGYNLSPSAEKSKLLMGNVGISDVVNEDDYDNEAVTSESGSILRNGLWNPGYIGLEEYRKLAKLSPDSVSAINGYATSLHILDQNDVAAAVSALQSSDRSTDASIAQENSCMPAWAGITVNMKDRGKLWVVVENNILTFWTNVDKNGNPAMGPYLLKNLVYVGKNPTNGVIELHVQENLLCNHWTHLKLVMADGLQSWILGIARLIMPKNELLLYSIKGLDAGGSVWIRQGTACAWSSGWMFLSEQKLYYILDSCALLFELDVRKFIGVRSGVSKVDWCTSIVGSTKGPFQLLQEGGSLFVQAENDSLTTTWFEILKHQMEQTGYRLEDSKLTADDVPVIVDKCIKFISTYGLLQPGLYRQNGPIIKVRWLLAELRKDPVNVHILPESDMINVVADVLRSFFRQLDSPLVPYHIQERLFAVANVKDSTRLDEYYEILMGLPSIRIQTLRRLLDHLKDVTEHANLNLATIENVAKIFGPTLFSVERDSNVNGIFVDTIQQVNLIKDLLTFYVSIFRISAREMSIKWKMNMLQEKTNQIKARADGFLVPVHILEKDNHTFNVQSSSTAEQVCEAARNRPVIRKEADLSNFALFEEIKCGQLERRVNSAEKMNTMITGRWLDWEPAECFLLFKRDPIPFSFQLSYPFADDIRIAEPGTKSFSSGHLKLESGLIIYYSKNLKKISEWCTDDILWYIGNESNRKPPYPHTLTFILPKGNFKYKSKYMGYCVAFREAMLRTQWLNAVVSAQHNFSETTTMPLMQI